MFGSYTTRFFFAAALVGLWPTPLTPRSSDFVAATPERVLGAFGLPSSVSATACSLSFTYEGKAGTGATFVFHDGVAIIVPGTDFEPGPKKVPDREQVYLGQSLREALDKHGAAKAARFGSQTLEVELGGKRISVAHGRVIAVH